MGLNVVLYQPEIPANTGNIARTCAAINATLHLIRPLGFSTDDKRLKRAGLDYWQYVSVKYYDSLDECFEQNVGGEFFYLTKFGEHSYTDFDYSDRNKEYFFVCGRETTGLPDELKRANRERCLRIPMGEHDHVQSLNLSNAVAIMVYEALKHQGYPQLS
ncbi:tRNA (cytidine/uridine-2'-O-)-methyltransferase [Pullulanibacillus pueri]|uniref:Putative tRNA (cytidine(34)-2'-O)-methyltransferase n=1 Tax=Pullulanibacillus pueri TaxID=1437324 RepID=A0A8J2ZX88_9BACL|nr:tRNA (uridine(34)/cytosine(34)/5-carboxymethylaminomethyluridine(34)-2'-O)-methyltransferase TrmL [Pullulanibacillus pueri]MBM7683580.1 tRNA (cytidine/uridine-2'-O-)-methyltransferase [Pullulanibacillus pueri]GGH84497.1 putative tRNA (cytidine(34)-2'-O)-methyltransferase [Pullulanibacillus pueri]